MTRHRERPSKRKNPSGKIVWVARYTNRDGKRVLTKPEGTFRQQGPCKDEREDGMCCAQHAIDHAYDLEQVAGSTRGAMTVRQYAETWTRTYPRSKRTNDTNEHRLAMVIGPFTPRQLAKDARNRALNRERRKPVKIEGIPLGDWPMKDLLPRHGKALLAALLVDQGRSALGAKNILLSLSAMTTDAIEDEYAILNPWNVRVRASDPRISKAARQPRVVSVEDMHRLAAAAGDHEAVIRVAADCGLRLGELLGLAAEDVKLGVACDELGCAVPGPHVHVRRTAHDGEVSDGTKRERLRDRGEGGRVVPLPATVASLLRGLPTRLAGTTMFFAPSGKTWRHDTFRNEVWNPARVASGVEASPQDFRHSWVTHCRARGVDPADLAQMAGHSLQTATATYTHALGRSYDAVREAMGG